MYICETTNYFDACESEFKARYKNHKILFTPY